MAKGNMLQGQATGKVGDIVFMVRNGQQISRVYTASGGRSGDQASIAVRRQRVRFGAASNQYLLYRNIVRGMYRTGKQTRQSDYNYFVRENVDLLPYLTKEENAAGVRCAMPGTFSRGTLGACLYSITAGAAVEGRRTFEVVAPSQFTSAEINLASTVSALKAAMKEDFTNARKVNLSICVIQKREVDMPSGTQWTHDLVRHDVVFDLYEEDPIVDDTATVGEYFLHYMAGSVILPVIAQSTKILYGDGAYFRIDASEADFEGMVDLLYVNVFATNDQVGDCYTSTLSEITAPDSDGGLSLYANLRTNNHRQVAEDSYGYATGVMRTNIQQA